MNCPYGISLGFSYWFDRTCCTRCEPILDTDQWCGSGPSQPGPLSCILYHAQILHLFDFRKASSSTSDIIMLRLKCCLCIFLQYFTSSSMRFMNWYAIIDRKRCRLPYDRSCILRLHVSAAGSQPLFVFFQLWLRRHLSCFSFETYNRVGLHVLIPKYIDPDIPYWKMAANLIFFYMHINWTLWPRYRARNSKEFHSKTRS